MEARKDPPASNAATRSFDPVNREQEAARGGETVQSSDPTPVDRRVAPPLPTLYSPAGRLSSVLYFSLVRLVFLPIVGGDTVVFLLLSSLRSTRPILRLAGSRRGCSRTQAPGDKLWVYKHALYFLPLFPSLCVCSWKDKVLFHLFFSFFFRPPPPASLDAPVTFNSAAVIAADAKPGQGFLFIYLFISHSIQKACFFFSPPLRPSPCRFKAFFWQGLKHLFGVERIPINLEVVCLVSPHQINFMQEGNRGKIVSPLKRNLSELQ